jgi:hypothetical protein
LGFIAQVLWFYCHVFVETFVAELKAGFFFDAGFRGYTGLSCQVLDLIISVLVCSLMFTPLLVITHSFLIVRFF